MLVPRSLQCRNATYYFVSWAAPHQLFSHSDVDFFSPVELVPQASNEHTKIHRLRTAVFHQNGAGEAESSIRESSTLAKKTEFESC